MTSVSDTAENLSVETGQYRECISGCNPGLDVKNSGSGLDVRIFLCKIRLGNKSANSILRAFSDSEIDVCMSATVLYKDKKLPITECVPVVRSFCASVATIL